MFVVVRFDVSAGCRTASAGPETALAALATRPGYLTGRVGRSVDEPGVDGGDRVAGRRCLPPGAVGVRRQGPRDAALALARDEPSAYETLLYNDGVQAVSAPSDRSADVSGPGNRGDHAR
ncbi:MAG: hypothetical protein WKF47_12705 [Geodermatophilaceae bacterium]